MEIQVLKLLVTEPELNQVLAREGIPGAPVRDLSVRFAAEGVHIKGKYQALIPMPFESMWTLSVQAGKILVRLADIKVVGFGASMLKGVLLDVIADQLQGGGAVQAEGDTLRVDLDHLLAVRGFPARTNITSVRCEVGRLFIESNLAP